MLPRKLDSGICINNFRASGVRNEEYGVAIIMNDEVCETAGVFTKNSIKSGSVIVSMNNIKNGFQAVVANSGNANACIRDSVRNAREMCNITANELDIPAKNIGVASTGIIGRELNLKKIRELIRTATSRLSNSWEGSRDAAKAIMTTDTKIKEISLEYEDIKIGAICKGSGMIAPNLATMLCFITTNANLSRETLQNELRNSVENSFNMLTIDNEMSTNDTVILMSDKSEDCDVEDFRYLLNYATIELAKMMAKDGEGATKFIQVEVRNAETLNKARIGAKRIASSALVKTAIYGENPNWGRIIAALGSIIEFDFYKTDIIFKSNGRSAKIVENGNVMDINDAKEILRGNEIEIIVDIKQGKFSATAFGCDLSPEYIRINAEYN